MVEPASPAAPVAETSDAAVSAIGQPASTEQADLQAQTDSSDMDAWIRDQAYGSHGRSTLNPDGVVPTAELESAASGESAPAGDVSPAAVPPGSAGDAGAPQTQGRRAGKAAENLATIESLSAELATLRSTIPDQVAEAQRAADEARAEAERLRSEQTTAESASYEMVGTLEELRRLQDIPFDEISDEDYRTRERWLANRKVFNPVQKQLATEEQTRAHSWVASTTQTWADQALTVADKLGVDKAALARPENRNVANLMQLAADATEARVRAEYAERLSQTERDLSAARGEALGGRRSPITNGAASGAAAGFVDDDTWLRQRAGFA